MHRIVILLAIYNGEKYLSKQLDSILDQDHEDFLVLIRDDGSSDNTINIIREYEAKDKRILLIEDKLGNLGFVKNFEELIKRSEGSLFMLCDQDDIWFSDKISRYLIAVQKEDMNIPLLIHSDAVICNEKEDIIKKSYISHIAQDTTIKSMFFNFFVQGASIMFNRRLKDIILPFIEGAYLHDRYIHIMAQLFGKRIFIPEATMYYRQHDRNQIGSGSNIIKKITNKRYFDERDRCLLRIIYEKYSNKMDMETKDLFMAYFNITSDRVNRLKRLHIAWKNNIRMHIFKKLFLILKG